MTRIRKFVNDKYIEARRKTFLSRIGFLQPSSHHRSMKLYEKKVNMPWSNFVDIVKIRGVLRNASVAIRLRRVLLTNFLTSFSKVMLKITKMSIVPNLNERELIPKIDKKP
jgi:hypothetical protein